MSTEGDMPLTLKRFCSCSACSSPPFAGAFDNEIIAFVQSGKRPIQGNLPSQSSGTSSGPTTYTMETGNDDGAHDSWNTRLCDMFSRLITACWDHDPSRRPTFAEVGIELQKIIEVCQSEPRAFAQLRHHEGQANPSQHPMSSPAQQAAILGPASSTDI